MGIPETEHNGEYPPPAEDEQALTLEVDWSPEEEKKAKRK